MQLKEFLSEANLVSASVSIPRGAVKRALLSRMVRKYAVFQFQEVQLKVQEPFSPLACARVSIPRGAVKSMLKQFLSKSFAEVSIPRGAVKSILSNPVKG